ncbi:hypothetical protein [Planomonospora sp. ID82291]|uniref:hypothetical protein n=1 Tax=Planomonospora sp. ID82291 TaxID=2738136 RepID=UPI0018C3BF32|nr:hypothetical protein [Planomonospora sp. ID82291]MBG0818200.1 hypothetical protein [Planomonospora sp. ID82291]
MQEIPEDLGDAGRVLWSSVTEDFDLGHAELPLLVEACRTADELVMMRRTLAAEESTVIGSTGQPKAHPLYAELRAHRLLLGKLLDSLALPVEDQEKGLTPNQERAQKAANVRWAMEREKWGRRGNAS